MFKAMVGKRIGTQITIKVLDKDGNITVRTGTQQLRDKQEKVSLWLKPLGN